MQVKDVKCPKCGGAVSDADPELDLVAANGLWRSTVYAVALSCDQGHKFIIGVRDPRKGMESLSHD